MTETFLTERIEHYKKLVRENLDKLIDDSICVEENEIIASENHYYKITIRELSKALLMLRVENKSFNKEILNEQF